jgi:hypothetical protein
MKKQRFHAQRPEETQSHVVGGGDEIGEFKIASNKRRKFRGAPLNRPFGASKTVNALIMPNHRWPDS